MLVNINIYFDYILSDSTIRSYILEDFLGNIVYTTFLCIFQHKMKNVVWTKGTSGLEGEFQSASEVDFYIDKVSTKNTLNFEYTGNICC